MNRGHKSGVVPDALDVVALPHRAEFSPIEVVSATGFALITTGGWFGPRRSGNISSGDMVVGPALLDAGTYAFSILGRADTNRGIATLYRSPDNVNFHSLGVVDWYVASGAQTRAILTGTLPTPGQWYFRWKITGQNGSSTGSNVDFDWLSIRRTGG